MRRLVAGAVALLLALAGAVATTAPASAAAKKVYKSWSVTFKKSDCWDLDVEEELPASKCQGPQIVVKNSRLKYADEDAWYTVWVYNSKGKRVYKKVVWGDQVGNPTIPKKLKRGGYRVVVKYESLGGWWCSKYNPDGCSWLEGETVRAEFKIKWRGEKVKAYAHKAKAVRD